MPGLLTHLIVALAGFLIVYFIFYKSKTKNRIIYGLAFVLGHILPDVVDFGVLGVKMGSINPSEIMQNPLFDTLAVFGHTFSNWLIIGLVVIAIAFFFYSIKKVSKKSFISLIISIISILIGILAHLVLDRLIQETSYWI
ncbi:MAG: hypothetical protein ABIH65_00100 [Nanoarchaeota archaeon]